MAEGMDNPFGLTGHHEKIVNDYLAFARSKREQRLMAVDGAIDDLRESKVLDENTYSCQEVVSMLDSLKDALHASVELELIDSDHTQVLLLCQVFQKAQKWRLSLEADISKLEDRRLLDDVAKYERGELPKSEIKLEPLADPAAFMRTEISDLKEENAKLRSHLEAVTQEASSISQEKEILATSLSSTKQALDKASSEGADSQVTALKSNLVSAKDELAKLKLSGASAGSSSSQETEEKLTQALHEVLALRHDLSLAKEDVDKKFNETSVYKNMMKMMTSKNDQLKDLRAKLATHESEN